jgi:hypothetical protein
VVVSLYMTPAEKDLWGAGHLQLHAVHEEPPTCELCGKATHQFWPRFTEEKEHLLCSTCTAKHDEER